MYGHADHHAQAVTLGGVEQPSGRHRIDTHRIEPVRRHARKVTLDDVWLWHFAAVDPRAKRPVGRPAQIQLVIADEEELAADVWPPFERRQGKRWRRARDIDGQCRRRLKHVMRHDSDQWSRLALHGALFVIQCGSNRTFDNVQGGAARHMPALACRALHRRGGYVLTDDSLGML